MRRITQASLCCALVTAGLLGLVVAGCRTTTAPAEPAAAPPTESHHPSDAMVQPDAQRAQAVIEEDRREMSGERRPADPGRERVVDQPRVGGRR